MDIQCYIESGRNSNPKKKTEHCIDYWSFKKYLHQQFILFRSEDQEKEELNQYHGRFLITLKIKDGTDYEPPSVPYNCMYGHQSATASALATGQSLPLKML